MKNFISNLHTRQYFFRCVPRECAEDRPEEKEGYKIVESTTPDGCCKVYRSVPSDCDVSSCPYQAPSCNYYEDLVAYSMDKCCSTYECKCNPAHCPDLGKLPCPTGSKRVVLNSDECCAVGKCIQYGIGSGNAKAGANSYAMMKMGSFVATFTNGEEASSNVDLKMANGIKSASNAEASGSLQLVAETALCVDNSGKEHKYGDCWYQHTDSCQLCTCYDASDIRWVVLFFFLLVKCND